MAPHETADDDSKVSRFNGYRPPPSAPQPTEMATKAAYAVALLIVGALIGMGTDGFWRVADGGVNQGNSLGRLEERISALSTDIADLKGVVRAASGVAFTRADANALQALLDAQLSAMRESNSHNQRLIEQHERRIEALEQLRRQTR